MKGARGNSAPRPRAQAGGGGRPIQADPLQASAGALSAAGLGGEFAREHSVRQPGLRRKRLSHWQWLRYGPFLVQLVVTRRCNLDCAYCSEFDAVSPPVASDLLEARLEKLAELRAWAVCLTGGEPTLHPDLAALVERMRGLGFRRRMLITNGYRLGRGLVEALNEAGLTDLQISIDGVAATATTKKVLDVLRPKLELLAEHARFDVVISAVIGSAPPAEALAVVECAKSLGFAPRVLLIHGPDGQLELTPEELAVYAEVEQRIGRPAREARDYRARLIGAGSAPFHCRAGARYLYVDEFGSAHWCSQTQSVFARDLMDYDYAELRRQFHAEKSCNATCTVGCARTASAYDGWRSSAEPARTRRTPPRAERAP